MEYGELTLDMVVSCQEDKSLPYHLFVVMQFHIFQGISRGGTWLATFDFPDMRGLSTASPFFIAELPLSIFGNSASLIP